MKRRLVFVLLILLLFPLVLSQGIGQTTSVSSNTFISSSIQVSNPSINIHYQEIQFNEYQNVCKDRTDFIIQVAPGGCTPNVVRSDLLAEQNVPVFCQLQAIQVNPTIDVSRIRNIRLVPVGERPEGIVGIGFQRANAALSFTRSRIGDRSTGFATVENIGYAVIVLKQQPNEDLQLDEIIGKLSARIEYDVPRGFGLGLQDKALSVLTEDEWQQDFQQYGFFEGKAFVRLESVETEGISVGIYADANRKINSVRIPRGQTSKEMYIPGFTCDAAFTIKYAGSQLPKPKALLEIGNNQYDVFSGNKFAEGFNCVVRSINADNYGAGTVNIQCNGQPISLSLKRNGVFLKVNGGEPRIYHLGEELEKDKYLAYFGTTKDGEGFIITYKEKDLPAKLENLGRSWESKSSGDIGLVGSLSEFPQASALLAENSEGNLEIVRGELEEIKDSDFEEIVEGARAINNNYKGLEIPDDLKLSFDNKETYGEVALFKAIELSISLGKQNTCVELRAELTEEYGEDSAIGLDCYQSFDITDSRDSFTIDGQSYGIRLLRIDVPDKDDKKFTFSIDRGNPKTVFNIGDEIYSDDDGNIMTLKGFNERSVTVEGNCPAQTSTRQTSTRQTSTIQEGKSSLICGKTVFVSSIHLKKLAKIKLNPINHNVGSEVEFEYGIGIEQRAIKLNPEKSLEKIKRLDEDIEKWNNVNDNLEGAVEGLKAACFATSAALQVKNLFGNLGGKAAARQEVMTVWHDRCGVALANGGTDLIKGDDGKAKTYGSKDDCFNQNSKEIESQVEDVLKVSEGVNAVIKKGEEGHIKKAGLLQGKTVSPEAGVVFTDKILPEEYGSFSDLFIGEDGNELRVMDVIGEKDGVKLSDSASYQQSIELYAGLKQYENAKANGNEQLEKMYHDNVYSILRNIDDEQEFKEQQANSKDIVKTLGLTGQGELGIASYEQEGKFIGTYKELSTGEIKGGIDKGTLIWRVTYSDKENSRETYYVALGPEAKFNGQTGRPIAQAYKSGPNNAIGAPVSEVLLKKIQGKYDYLIKIDAGSYATQYDNPEVIYHETAPLKGKAAVVPINTKKGWYAGTRNTLPSLGGGYQSPVQDSGLPQVFWLCNVGKDNKQQFFSTDFGNDHCERFTLNAGQAPHFDGISTTEVRSLVKEAECALREAAREWKQGVKTVSGSSCLGRNIPVGNPAPSLPGTSCADFMSPKECQLMFNVCDPVICPNSRCNLGGNYYVDNVVNTGIVGSALLCLPNAQEGIAIPVCLTGINAGIEAYTSILEAHRDCLQEHVDTGRYVGICDEVTAVYQCEFFWNQVAPLTSTLLPNILGKIKGNDVPRGGGEYMNVAGAWDNMKNSISFFKDKYAVNSLTAYRQRSTQEVGTDVCKAFVSSSFPSDFKTLIEADSPSQFTGWFDEIPMSSAVVPAQSHYKVFYHIFAGDDQGVHFSVYLKNAPGTSFFQDSGVQMVDTGFIPRGEYADEARDLTSVSGFKELCIRINNQDKCGFQKVSTNFAINFARDKFIENQLTEQNIASEKACISGTPSFSGLLNPNLQSGIQDAAIDPQIYQSGIIRVCATGDPGSQTSPGQWTDVGHCGDQRIRCWLDTDSIDRALSVGNNITRQTTISELGLMADKLEEDQTIVEKFFRKLIGFFNNVNEATSSEDVIVAADKLISFSEKEKPEFILDISGANVDLIEIVTWVEKLKAEESITLENTEPSQPPPQEVGTVEDEQGDDVCAKYDQMIDDSLEGDEKYLDMDPDLVKAIMRKESPLCDPNENPDDESFGLMGITKETSLEICPAEFRNDGKFDDEKLDPQRNIFCGIQILQYKFEHPQNDPHDCGYVYLDPWKTAVRGYNGWGCENPGYVDDVYDRYDELKAKSGNTGSSSSSTSSVSSSSSSGIILASIGEDYDEFTKITNRETGEEREKEVRNLLDEYNIKINRPYESIVYTSNGKECKDTCVGPLQQESLIIIFGFQLGLGEKGDLEITGAAETLAHNPGSPHFEGLAIDLAVTEGTLQLFDDYNNLEDDEFSGKYNFLKGDIKRFDDEREKTNVKWSGPHFHIEVVDKKEGFFERVRDFFPLG